MTYPQITHTPPKNLSDLVGAHGKSPWNPSRKAITRVPDPLPPPISCSLCGGPVDVSHHDRIYGRAYSDWPWVYACTCCDARVGMHPFTPFPLGTMADADLREARKTSKAPFESIWKSGAMQRGDAYAALASHMGIPISACHFGMFDHAQCAIALVWALGQKAGK